jgi:hypothetical protein
LGTASPALHPSLIRPRTALSRADSVAHSALKMLQRSIVSIRRWNVPHGRALANAPGRRCATIWCRTAHSRVGLASKVSGWRTAHLSIPVNVATAPCVMGFTQAGQAAHITFLGRSPSATLQVVGCAPQFLAARQVFPLSTTASATRTAMCPCRRFFVVVRRRGSRTFRRAPCLTSSPPILNSM